MLSGNTTVGDTARAFKELHAKLDGFNMRSVYWCDVTNMFLGAMPTRTFQNGAQENHKIRHGPGILEIDGYGDMVVDAGAEDLTTSVFKDWLTRFGRMRALPFKVALLVDEAVWRLLEVDPSESTYATGGVTVFKVPRELSALMPLSDGIAKELKANFHILLMEAKKAAISRPTGAATPASVTQINDISIEDHLKFIPEAWNRVPSVTLNHSFKRFLPSTPLLPLNDGDQQHVDSVPKLKRALEDAFPAFPDYILEYYLHHDRDVGPSSFLRAKIQEMQRHPDYENLFGTLSFGEVRDVSERLQFSSLNPHLESQNNLRLVHEKPENERPKVNSYYPEGVFFAKPYEFPGEA
ncbi:hypothetical protein BGZ58_000025 [Dissophora ornata]|nr:hypothetical protein BGZ58_000025 [Dissophora ornata]